MEDLYKANDSLGMNIERSLRPVKHEQQPNMDAYKLPSRKGVGNDMGVIPNAVNGTRYVGRPPIVVRKTG